VEFVYLFGSFARGDIHEGSDIDLIIIGDFSERFHERIYRVLLLNDQNLPLAPLCYRPEEVEQMQGEGNPFILEALASARLL
jgi:UTP:GlnB (protein PII) uridylyltransferase